MNEEAEVSRLESIVDANYTPFVLAYLAWEKLRAMKGNLWPDYKANRWNNLDGYSPRIRRTPEPVGLKSEQGASIWEMQQMITALEREIEALADATRPIGQYGDKRGTPEQHAELAALRKRVKELNRRIGHAK